ncbi:cytochrome c [Shimia sp.]|uniref:c-type cytochrome n=1 Tax=Shimia sp. TaxID=1954381 RepID=UPI00329A1FE8
MGWRFWAVLISISGIVVLNGCSMNLKSGRVTYEQNCAQCHGVTGLGDGTFADKLITPPSDLTALARNNAGAFPALYVTDVIDGYARSDHFSGAMPEFGPALGGEELRLGPLVDYIESLQR